MKEKTKKVLRKVAGRHVLVWFKRLRKVYRVKFTKFGLCNICGRYTIFCGTGAITLTQKKYRNDLNCIFCGAKSRTRCLVSEILRECKSTKTNLHDFSKDSQNQRLHIYSASSYGAVHDGLSKLENFVCSEYFPNTPPGTCQEGVRCEDIENLTFEDDCFNLMLSEDVMEHVRHPAIALREAYRVLKPGGKYIFTVPIYGDETLIRVDTTGAEDIHVLPPVYHGDPLRSEGALAYNDFGFDIVELCEKEGFITELKSFNADDKSNLCGDVVIATKPNN